MITMIVSTKLAYSHAHQQLMACDDEAHCVLVMSLLINAAFLWCRLTCCRACKGAAGK